MIKWLKQFGAAQNLKNKAGLSREKLLLLAKEFHGLSKIKPGLAQRILQYIVDDEGEEVLLELGGCQDCGKALGLGWCVDINYFFTILSPTTAASGGITGLLKWLTKQYPRQYRLKFFSGIDTRQPGLYYRLAQVYEEASRCDRKKLFFNIPGVEDWLEFLLLEAVDYNFVVYDRSEQGIDIHLTAEFVEKILEMADVSTDMFTRAVFLLDVNNVETPYLLSNLTEIKGFYQRVSSHPRPVLEALDHKSARQRVYALEILSHPDVDLEPFKEKIVTLAVSNAKTVRKAASAIITQRKEIFAEPVKHILKQGSNNQRVYAVSLLWLIAGKKEETFLKQHLEEESSQKVKEAITGVLTEPQPEEKEEQGTDLFQLPPLEVIATVSPLPREVLDTLSEFVTQYNREIEKRKEIYKKNKYFKHYKWFDIPTTSIGKIFNLLQEMKVVDNKWKSPWIVERGDKEMKLVKGFLERPELELIHVIRFLMMCNFLYYNSYESQFDIAGIFEELLLYHRRVRDKTFGLREIAAAFKAIGIEPDVVAWSCIQNWYGKPAFMWDKDSLWPFFAENLYLLEEIFDLRPHQRKINSYWRHSIRKNAFIILTQFPAVPASFHAWLWEIALGTTKTERAFAREILEKIPGIEPRIIEALKSGRQEVRAVAADWLAKLKTTKAIPQLKTALEKEKSDLAKGAMMEALEVLGVPVEEFLDRSSMKKEAAASLKKGIPSQLSWFPFDGIPLVHWQDSGEPVDPDILKWLLLLGYKLKSPEPGPALRKYCSYMVPAERAAFGKYVLDAWITQDTILKYTHEEAVSEAKNQVKQMSQWLHGEKAEDFYRQILSGLLNECKGSAVKEKGILAAAAACCNADCVPTIQGYLKKWYGIRAAQSKALVQMLAWVDHPLAAQLLLSVANRFRTKSIREEAEKCVKKLAERQGWTIEELADRTIPGGGFDETGKMELDYGSRSFTCRLGEDFKISIVNESGKVLKSLPGAAKADDPDKVKAAKQDLSSAKKIVKSVLKLQKDRLYESMCTQRRLKYRDLRDYLFTHPIVSRYCQQLVWVMEDENKITITFRPMEDGSLTDHRDNEVTLADSAQVRLAHSCNTDEKTAAAWPAHFRDYGMTPLFTQFRREMYTLKQEDKELTEILEFQGYMLDNFKLRGMANKLGYSRGQARDGGFFYEYTKRFTGLGIETVIEFTGSPLPEENNRVALLNLHFLETSEGPSDSYWSERRLNLERIPAVLLSETWNDMKQIALSGSGYDEEWEKKLEY